MTTQTTLNTSAFIYKPRRDGNRQERYYELTCGQCSNTYHLRMHDARKAVTENRPCKSCAARTAGAVGAAVTMERYGKEFLLAQVVKQQLAHPSRPEQQIAIWLDELGVTYKRQVIVNLGSCNYIVDFMLDGGKCIEGAGGYWHDLNKGDKDEMLAQAMIVLFLTDELVMKSPTEAFALIKRFVEC